MQVTKTPNDAVTLVDFAIITAVRAEFEAIKRAFQLRVQDRVKCGTRVYWRGRLHLSEGKFYELIAVQSSETANVDASLVTNDTIHWWSPGAVLLVGFAGAAHDGSDPDDENLGDVIVGSDTYYYERGKITNRGQLPEPSMFKANSTLWNNFQNLEKWTTRIKAKRPDGKRVRPRVLGGVIAAGEKVISDKSFRDKIVRGHRKIRAIEMEGYGFSKAVWAAVGSIPHMVIKAISDRADRRKGDDWQDYSAAAAASFTKHLLLDEPIAPRNLPELDITATTRVRRSMKSEPPVLDLDLRESTNPAAPSEAIEVFKATQTIPKAYQSFQTGTPSTDPDEEQLTVPHHQ